MVIKLLKMQRYLYCLKTKYTKIWIDNNSTNFIKRICFIKGKYYELTDADPDYICLIDDNKIEHRITKKWQKKYFLNNQQIRIYKLNKILKNIEKQ